MPIAQTCRSDTSPPIVTLSEAGRYLAQLGLLRSSEECRQARPVSGRAANTLVTLADGPGLFIKQGVGDSGRTTIANESIVLKRLRAHWPELEQHLPDVRWFDNQSGTLVLAAIEDAIDIATLHARVDVLLPGIPCELGSVLGLIHGTPLEPQFVELPPPWILSFHRPTPAGFAELPAPSRNALAAVQASLLLVRAIDDLARTWAADCVVHYDVGWSNMVLPGARAAIRGGLVLVDFELCGAGDRSWDLGCAAADSLWHQIPMVTDAGDLDWTWMELALGAYLEASPELFPETATLTRRSVRMAAARLLQRATECDDDDLALRGVTLVEQIMRNSTTFADPIGASVR